MNYSTAIFLISDQVRAIAVTYEDEENAKHYTFKSLDPTIKVDDYVVIPTSTRHHMTVCKVAEVDVEVDLDTDTQYKWIIGVVSRADFEEIERQENEAIAKIKSAEKARRREELRTALLKDTGDELKALPIYSNDKKET